MTETDLLKIVEEELTDFLNLFNGYTEKGDNASVFLLHLRSRGLVIKHGPYEEIKKELEYLKTPEAYEKHFGAHCSCVCHKDKNSGGWNSLECCPDCGSSLCSNVTD